jgi:hypothetical protein
LHFDSRLILPTVVCWSPLPRQRPPILWSPRSGRAISVRAVRTENDEIVVQLRVPRTSVDYPSEVAQGLKTLLSRYELPLALAVYNAGEAAVNRFGGLSVLSRS